MSKMADRSSLQAKIFPLGQEPGDDLSASTTAAERLAMLCALSQEAWAFAGFTMPAYGRHEIPIKIVPLATRAG
jgi:hypothetical protein